jgi:hypothetical protein
MAQGQLFLIEFEIHDYCKFLYGSLYSCTEIRQT